MKKSSTANYEKILKVISHRVQSMAMELVELEAKRRQCQLQISQMDTAIQEIQTSLLNPDQLRRFRTNDASSSVMGVVHVNRNECDRLSEQIQGLSQKRLDLEDEIQALRAQYKQEYAREQALQKLLDRRRSESRLERMKRDQLQLEESSAQKNIRSADVEFVDANLKSDCHSSGEQSTQYKR
ncbi:hypothetical protein [Thalassoglobus polymorphus]|nr:hypothetical protein [Thalassoglobus polymorphus]